MQSVLAAVILTLKIIHTYPGHTEWQTVLELTTDSPAKSVTVTFMTVENGRTHRTTRRLGEAALQELQSAWGNKPLNDLSAYGYDPICPATAESWRLSVGADERLICRDKAALGRLSRMMSVVFSLMK